MPDLGNTLRHMPFNLHFIRVQVPTKRSGHSFTVVESTGYLFGGVPQARPPGPTNEMFKLDMSNRESRGLMQRNLCGRSSMYSCFDRVRHSLFVKFITH